MDEFDDDFPFYDDDYTYEEPKTEEGFWGQILYGISIVVVILGFIAAICGKIPLW